jgi:hypothetical protein
MTDAFAYLQAWYAEHCDGDWEHDTRIAIGTLDNPGWHLTVNLDGTGLAGRTLDRQRLDRSEQDWLHYWSDGDTFKAAGGSRNLVEVVRAFQEFAEGSST